MRYRHIHADYYDGWPENLDYSCAINVSLTRPEAFPVFFTGGRATRFLNLCNIQGTRRLFWKNKKLSIIRDITDCLMKICFHSQTVVVK